MPRDEDDFNFKELLNLIKDLASKVVQSERGISLMAVALGLGMKQIPRRLKITESFKDEQWIIDTMKEKGWDENQFCLMDERARRDVSGFAKQPICEMIPEHAIDLFPINNLFGVPIEPDVGKVPISDFLILMGGLGVAALSVETISKLRELIK